jgi:hypothetical protein
MDIHGYETSLEVQLAQFSLLTASAANADVVIEYPHNCARNICTAGLVLCLSFLKFPPTLLASHDLQNSDTESLSLVLP